MKEDETMVWQETKVLSVVRNRGLLACACLGLWLLWPLPNVAFAQAQPAAEAEQSQPPGQTAQPPGQTAQPAGQTAQPAGQTAQPAAPSEPAKVVVNLKDAPIDQVVKFLSDNTGKAVVRNKDVKAQITVVSPEPVTPQRAVELICGALRIEGVAVVERDGVINLIPAAKVAEMGVAAPGEAPGAGLVRKIIAVHLSDAEQMAKLVTPLLSEGSKVVADARSAKLILTVRGEELESLEKLISQLDVVATDESAIRIFQLKHAPAEELAPVIAAIVSATGTTAAPAEPSGGPAPKPDKPPSGAPKSAEVAVVPYVMTNWLVVRVPKDKLEIVAQLVADLDVEKPPQLELNVIPVRNADARNLASQLADLYRRRPKTRDARDVVEIAADERANSVIVYSNRANFELISKIVAELDTESSRKTETRSYELKYADAEDVASQLNELYSGQQQQTSYYDYWFYPYSTRGDTVTVRFVPERRTNTLIVIAAPTEFQQIGELISKLDQPLSTSEVQPRIYHIRNVDAKELTDVLNDIFGVQQETQTGGYYYYMYRLRSEQETIGRLYGKVRFVLEAATNSIIVITNNAQNFPIIEGLIRELDKTTAEYANTMVYRLENADAIDVADQLNNLFAPPGAGKPAEAQKQDAEEAARTAYYSWLMGTSAREAQERPISNLIGKVRVVPDPRTNSLLITTAVQNFEVVGQLVRSLDLESPKVLIRVQFLEITRSEESRAGVRLASNGTIFESKDFNNGLLGAFGFTWEQVTANTVLSATVNVSAIVQFLQREFNARILSQPMLVVNNNREATIFIGAQVPFIEKSLIEPGTTARSDSFSYKEVGTKLVIRPHINEKKKVVTTVALTDSQIREGQVLFGGFILDSRSYNTELAVENGQTVVIGGILRQDESEIVNRVPVLGHIPLIGLLFRKKDTLRTTTELIAFITPTVLRTREEDDAATRAAREAGPEMKLWLPQWDQTRGAPGP
jgi:general secretion pathway protein D